MTRLKVMTILGTRPEIIRLSRVIAKLDSFCDHTLVHTGQNYDWELNGVFFEQLEIRSPDLYLDAARDTPAGTIGQVISSIDPVLEAAAPDAVLILGDTNSSLAAIAAKRRKIPIFHMEAGNRCFDQRVPEEINRKLVDHLADVNLTYSDIAREYLLREGLPPDRVIKTGSPMKEVLTHYESKIRTSDILQRLGLQPLNYYVVSIHREENVDPPDRLARLAAIVNQLADRNKRPAVLSTHPRTRKRIESMGIAFSPGVVLSKPLGFPDYIKLQMDAMAVLSDSGTITEEASILGLRALNLRDVHERPEGMEQAAVTMVSPEWEAVERALAIVSRGDAKRSRIVRDYDVDDVSEKVVRIIHSYTPYVDTFVWRKDASLQ